MCQLIKFLILQSIHKVMVIKASELFVVIRLPDRQYQGKNGPVDNLSEAVHYANLTKAYEKPVTDSIGVTEFRKQGKTLTPLRHLTTDDVQKELKG